MDEEIIIEDIIEEVAEAAQPAVRVDPIEAVGSEVVSQTKEVFHLDEIKNIFTWATAAKIFVGVITFLILFFIYKFLKRLVNKKLSAKLQSHTRLLLNKAITYTFYVLAGMYILSCFGVNLSAVWGAAGVAGLAIGFAAQTSVSNLISGLFVLGEKAMRVGDYIEVDGASGVVDSINLLSVNIHTLDNQMIRIPNSTIINENFKNYSHFTTRRLMFDIPISYETDMQKALDAVKRVPGTCPTVLQEPEPVIYYDGFGVAVNLKLGVWIESKNLLACKTEVLIAIKRELEKDGIQIPYEHLDIRVLGGNN